MADIDIKVGASGVSQFKQQMNQAAGAVKGINAELKLAEAQYQATGDQATYLARKTSLLKKQLEEQKKAVSAAEQALEAVKKQYGESSSQAQAWRTKLAQAKTTLVQTETALRNVEGAASDADTSTKDLGTSMANVSKKLDYQAIITGIDKIDGALEKVIKKAAQMGKAVWEAGTDAASWADSTRDAATAAHMSTTEYQQLAYAAQFFGTSVEALTKTQGRLSKAMASADGEVIAVGDSLVNTMTYVSDGMGGYVRQKRKWSDVLLDTIDALGEIEDPAERDAAAMELFGKSYSELSGIVEGGTDAFRKRMEEAPVVSEETVENLANTADAVKEMDSQLQTLKMELLNALAPSIETIAKAVGSLAQKLTEFVQSEEGQKLVQNLATSIENVITALAGDNFDNAVQAAKNVLEGLNNALEWLSKNSDSVVTAIKAIAASVLILKSASAGLTLANSLNSLKNLVNKGGGAGGAGGAGTGASAAGAAAAGKPAFATKFAAAASNTWWSVGVPALVVAGGVAPAMVAQQKDVEHRDADVQGKVSQAEAAAEALGESANQWMEIVNIAAEATGIDPTDKDWLGFTKLGDPAKVDRGLKALEPYGDLLASVLSAEQMGELQKYWNGTSELDPFEVTQLLDDVLTKVTENMNAQAAGMVLPQTLAEGINAAAPEAIAAAESMASAVNAIVDGAMANLNSAIFATSRAGWRPGTGTNSTFNANSSMYIGTYNQNSGGDATVLAAQVSAAQRAARRSFGARK